jgi:hypothetical protein
MQDTNGSASPFRDTTRERNAMATELSIYHQKNLQKARERVAELSDLKAAEMSPRDLLLWLTRMEAAAQDLLNIINLLAAAAHAEGGQS